LLLPLKQKQSLYKRNNKDMKTELTIESQRNQTSSMTEEKYEALCKLAQFGDAEGENAMEQLEEFHAMQAQQSAMETVKFKWFNETEWKTLKHLGNPFTNMDEAIKFVRHNKTEWGLELKLKVGTSVSESQWDNF
jgi:hypothetical protein